MAGCRDCERCTEVGLKSLGASPFRLVSWVLTSWNVRLFRSKCPQCHHRMSLHRMVGERFQD